MYEPFIPVVLLHIGWAAGNDVWGPGVASIRVVDIAVSVGGGRLPALVLKIRISTIISADRLAVKK